MAEGCTCNRRRCSEASCRAAYNRKAQRKWRLAHPAKHAAKVRAHQRRHPERHRAHVAVRTALRKGRLVKGPCERLSAGCAGRIEGHHDDYSKPLVVRWLCIYHHTEVHLVQARA